MRNERRKDNHKPRTGERADWKPTEDGNREWTVERLRERRKIKNEGRAKERENELNNERERESNN
jgi:hypothetical protein